MNEPVKPAPLSGVIYHHEDGSGRSVATVRKRHALRTGSGLAGSNVDLVLRDRICERGRSVGALPQSEQGRVIERVAFDASGKPGTWSELTQDVRDADEAARAAVPPAEDEAAQQDEEGAGE